jgi:hypothetical protein
MEANIDLFTMIAVGVFIQEFHFGITRYPILGERTTEPIFGEVIHGTIILYTIMISKETGGPGMTPTIGINQSTVRLHTIMMERPIVLLRRNLEQAIQERSKRVQLQPLKETWKRWRRGYSRKGRKSGTWYCWSQSLHFRQT